jgi:hypothetical protein
MKANEFVKKFGLNEARKQIKKPIGIYGAAFDYQFMDELKHLVESYELVEAHGGLPQAREVAHKNCFEYPMRLLQAVADVESCK